MRILLSLWLVIPMSAWAWDPQVYAVDVRVQVESAPPRIILSWPNVSYAREYVIRRKGIRDGAWSGPIAVLPGTATSFTDSSVALGASYEYEVQMATSLAPWPSGDPAKWIYAYTYVYAGVQTALQDFKGRAILVVDNYLAPSISGELAQYQQNLVGAGWNVIRRDVARTASPVEVRNIIRSEYSADPGNTRAVILIGHVPVPYSGDIAPDFHASHRGAWPADVFYGEMDGNWTDHTVSVQSGDSALNNNFPGDGKFDQSQIPSGVELEVGRIDFWNLPAFAPRTEVDLLRNYLRKNHQFRHRLVTFPRRGLIRDNFGDLDGDAPAVDAWRHYGTFFGPGSTRVVGSGQFFPVLSAESFLWSYGCGGGGFQKADGVGSTWDFAASNPRTAFLILHGSYFGDWNYTDAFLRAAIATPDYTLASVWSGLPHWFLHHMALGQTIGYSTRVSQNNVNLYKSQQNFFPNLVHISLIGDPTLEMFPVIPPSNLTGQGGQSVTLSWNASLDSNLVGYHVYWSTSASGPFQRITSTPIASTGFTHNIGAGTHHYMVRAIKLETTGSGSFYNASQGVFTTVTSSGGGGTLPVVTVTVSDGDAGEAGPNSGSFLVSRGVAGLSSLSVSISIGGSAVNGSDYQSIANSVTIPAGASSALVNIVPIADGVAEGDETVTITVNGSGNYTVGSPSAATLVIKDSSMPNERPTISAIADQSISANGSTGDLAFTIGDAETPAHNLSVRASSSNQSVIPNSNIQLGGSGANRTIRVNATSQTGQAKITVVVSDGSLEGMRNFYVTVGPGNQPPVAFSQQLTLNEDTPRSITLTGSDPEGAALQFTVLTQPTYGTLSGTPPSLVYRPAAEFFGSDSFTFRVSDGTSSSAAATISLTVNEVNDPPVALSQTVQTPEDTPKVITLAGSDVDTPKLTFTVTVHPTKGNLTGVPPNLTYTPQPNFFGTDSLQFKVNDGSTDSAPATVTIQVMPVNDPPQAVAANLTTNEDTPLSVVLTGRDPDGDPITFQIATQPTRGQLTGSPPNLVYTPFRDQSGQDSFTFKVSDGVSESAPATISITVVPVNDPPAISAISPVALRKNGTSGPISFTISDVDTALSSLSLSGTSDNPGLLPANSIVFSGTGEARSVSLTPVLNMTGSARITVRVSDAQLGTETAFTLTVTNTPPVAVEDVVKGNSGKSLSIATSGLLANDYDADNDSLVVRGVSTGSDQGGSVSLSGTTVTYNPPSNFSGTDRFTYTIEDSSGATAVGIVRVEVGGAGRILEITLEGTRFTLRGAGPANKSFNVLGSENAREWRVLGSGRSNNQGEVKFEETITSPHRFYALEWP